MSIGAVVLPGGAAVPALGQGTWQMGESPARRSSERAALRRGVELGLSLVDTAEMYGDGASERLIAEALLTTPERRREVFLVSKVLPTNAGKAALPAACRRSLKRLGTEWIDLYLLHWRGSVPLQETVAAMQLLVQQGLIRHWGVSNFDGDDLQALAQVGGEGCATNQILYNLGRRGPEFSLLPAMAGRGMPCMAYSPVEQGRLKQDGALAAVAQRHGVAPLQIAVAWLLGRPGTIVIPKAGTVAHVEQNRAAADLVLSDADLAALDTQFPPPHRKRPLEMI